MTTAGQTDVIDGATAKALAAKRDAAIGADAHGLQLVTLADMWRFAQHLAESDFVPKDFHGKTANVLAAIQLGAEVGLSPMQSVQRIAVINGRPTIWGDAMLGLCRRSPQFDNEGFAEWFTGTPFQDDYTAHCRARRRRAQDPSENEYSVADAKRAKLWGKPGSWTTDPKRMLRYRCRAFTLRDAFPDVLMGLYAREEMLDVEPGQPSEDSSPTSEQLRAQMSMTAALRSPAPEDCLPVEHPTADFSVGPDEAETAEPDHEPPADDKKPIGTDSKLFKRFAANYSRLEPFQRDKIRKQFGFELGGMRVVADWPEEEAQRALDAIQESGFWPVAGAETKNDHS